MHQLPRRLDKGPEVRVRAISPAAIDQPWYSYIKPGRPRICSRCPEVDTLCGRRRQHPAETASVPVRWIGRFVQGVAGRWQGDDDRNTWTDRPAERRGMLGRGDVMPYPHRGRASLVYTCPRPFARVPSTGRAVRDKRQTQELALDTADFDRASYEYNSYSP